MFGVRGSGFEVALVVRGWVRRSPLRSRFEVGFEDDVSFELPNTLELPNPTTNSELRTLNSELRTI
jgi:hypothetical protein